MSESEISRPVAEEPQETPLEQDPLPEIEYPSVQSIPAVENERPELAVAGAFAGGLILALLLRRVGS
ncbi:MAG TPA: hypothetical protein VID48_11465 [Solirubrobacteraceae bacterium]